MVALLSIASLLLLPLTLVNAWDDKNHCSYACQPKDSNNHPVWNGGPIYNDNVFICKYDLEDWNDHFSFCAYDYQTGQLISDPSTQPWTGKPPSDNSWSNTPPKDSWSPDQNKPAGHYKRNDWQDNSWNWSDCCPPYALQVCNSWKPRGL